MAKLMAIPCHSFLLAGTLIPNSLMVFAEKGKFSGENRRYKYKTRAAYRNSASSDND
jgi:hypothetical protein